MKKSKTCLNLYNDEYLCSVCWERKECEMTLNEPNEDTRKSPLNKYPVKDNKSMSDNINKPSHYTDRNFETILVIEDIIKANDCNGHDGYLLGNVIKYLSRYNLKGESIDNLKKAKYYLDALIAEQDKVK